MALNILEMKNTENVNLTLPPVANVIVFGQAGAGKSSLVNLVAGRPIAKTSDSTRGCTFQSTCYNVDMPGGLAIKMWDTSGFEEEETGTVETAKAISNVYKLTRDLKDGVSLLVYCVRGRITNETLKNYRILKFFCESKVPVALVVTALEHTKDKAGWWNINGKEYENAGIIVEDHACISTIRLEDDSGQYAASANELREMIIRAHLDTPWRASGNYWAARVIAHFIGQIFSNKSAGTKRLKAGLKKGGFSASEVKAAIAEYNKTEQAISAGS